MIFILIQALYFSTARNKTNIKTKIKFQMKIKDEFGLDIRDIKSSIEKFYNDIDYYFLQEFDVQFREGTYIYIGGGSGFVTKTSTYPYLGENKKAKEIVGKILADKFRKIKHRDLSVKNGVSPQVLKLTKYKNEYYEMGLCKIDFKEVK